MYNVHCTLYIVTTLLSTGLDVRGDDVGERVSCQLGTLMVSTNTLLMMKGMMMVGSSTGLGLRGDSMYGIPERFKRAPKKCFSS